MLAHYIIDMRNDDFSLIGPFNSADDLRAYSQRPDFNPEDDPRWQSVVLPRDAFFDAGRGKVYSVPLVSPSL